MESVIYPFEQPGHQNPTLVSRLMSGALKPIVLVANESKLFLVFKPFIILSSVKRKLLKIRTKGKTVANQGRVKIQAFQSKINCCGKAREAGKYEELFWVVTSYFACRKCWPHSLENK